MKDIERHQKGFFDNKYSTIGSEALLTRVPIPGYYTLEVIAEKI